MKNIIIGIVAVLALLVGGYAAFKPAPPAPEPKEPVGATSVQVTDGDCLFMNGQHICTVTKPLVTATSTPCAIKTANATSTLLWSTVGIKISSTTATSWYIARAANAFATTTPLGHGPVPFALGSGANGTMTIQATSSNSSVDTAYTFPPNTFVVWAVAGMSNSYDATKLTGTCSATLVY